MDRLVGPLPPEHQIASELRDWDKSSFDERLERSIFLRQLTEPPPLGWSVPGSIIGASAWWEAGRCFIGGNFIATVILTQCFVEHSLAEVLRRTGKAMIAGLSFGSLIDAATRIGEVPADLAVRLHALRRLRNPYVHADADTWPPVHLERALREAGGDPYALTDSDARVAIETTSDYVRHIASRWDELAKAQETG